MVLFESSEYVISLPLKLPWHIHFTENYKWAKCLIVKEWVRKVSIRWNIMVMLKF